MKLRDTYEIKTKEGVTKEYIDKHYRKASYRRKYHQVLILNLGRKT